MDRMPDAFALSIWMVGRKVQVKGNGDFLCVLRNVCVECLPQELTQRARRKITEKHLEIRGWDVRWCRGGELNSLRRPFQGRALPVSYPGTGASRILRARCGGVKWSGPCG